MKNTTTARIAALAGAVTFAVTLAACGGLTSAEEGKPVEAPTIEAEDAEPVDIPEAEAPAIPEDAETEEEQAAATQGGPGVYQANLLSGGTATVAVPGTGPEDLEQFRQDAGAEPVGYLVIEVDNTEGTEEAMIFEAEVVDSEGKTYTYEEVTTGTYDWLGSDASIELMERQMDLWDKYPYTTRPSAKNTVPLVGPEVPEDIVSVFVDYEQAERVGDI